MLLFIQQFRADAIAFDLFVLFSAVLVHRWLKRLHGQGLSRGYWMSLPVVLIAGIATPEIAARLERTQMRRMLEGIAPTYAQELSLAGHSELTLDTPPTDPTYRAMVAAQLRWEQVNPNVADIYTMRLRADGRLVLVVDSETDYDGDGQLVGDPEARTAIGEAYEQATPNMFRTFGGKPQFDDLPVTDRWGTWVSAYAPMFDAEGRVEAICGVDYDVRDWLAAIERDRAAALGLTGVLSVILLSSATVVAMTRGELERRTAAERERSSLQKQLVDVSRQAGMAEVATNVLHNVGNVLNSVNVSAGLATEQLETSRMPALLKAADMMRDHRADLGEFLTTDERGKLLPDYFATIGDVIAGEQQKLANELSALTRSVHHIKQIVASQQSIAKRVDETEAFSIAEVIDEAIRMNSTSITRHEVQIAKDLTSITAMTSDRHKILQILTNLVANAAQALAGMGGAHWIRIQTEPADGEAGRVIRFIVTDNGAGIARENADKIFAHGYTTRRDGHGFGLHASAIAAQQMAGRLSMHSGGVGRGATFTLEVPLIIPNHLDKKLQRVP